ncbi:MAG: TolB family protein, partial [Phycisphaerae bacterium]
PRFSADGKRIAFWRRAGARHELCAMTADGADVRVACSVPANAEPGTAEWSPDGRHLAFVAAGAVNAVPAAGGEPARVTAASGTTLRWR